MEKIGIDFGTSFCSASWINPVTKRPEAITFYETGTQKMPSIVHYPEQGDAIVGQMSYNILEDSGSLSEEKRKLVLSSTIASIKRKMQQDGVYYIHGRNITHETVIKDILLKIKTEVETTCFQGKTISQVSITHPVVFGEWQKKLLKSAALQAGFKEVELYEEPISAAIGYMESTGRNSSGMMVYDFGGGTFDVAYVMKDEDGNYRVPVAPEGDPFCGGDDIDLLLYDEWDKFAQQEKQRSISENNRTIDIGFLTRCRKQKESMSMSVMSQQTFTEILPPPGLHRIKMSLDKKRFEEIILPIVDKTIHKTKLLLKKIQDGNYPLDTAIMIGGSSRIPLIYERLAEILPVKPQKVMAVDVAVALGAVICGVRSQPDIPSSPPSLKPCFCIKCGKEMKRTQKFCMLCGEKNNRFNV